MGSKGSQSTSTVAIPQDVLNRYNSVNQTAQNAAAQPFQPYSQDSNAFVAPLTPTQQSGVSQTNQYANSAQPYFDAATGQLVYSQQQTQPYFDSAGNQIAGATSTGAGLAGASLGALEQAQSAAYGPNAAAGQAYTQAQGQAQPFNMGALLSYIYGQQAAQPLQGQAASNLTGAQAAGAQGTGQALNTLSGANAASNPYYDIANANLTGAQGVGGLLAGSSLGTLAGANATTSPFYGSAAQYLGTANAAANPYNSQAAGNINAGLGAGSQINNLALQQYLSSIGNAGGLGAIGNAASGIASGGASGAMGAVQSGINQADPYLQSAGGYYGNAIGAAAPLQGQAASGFTNALGSSQGDLNASGNYITGGAQSVNPSALDAAAINQYMSPYLQSVLQGTSGLLNQNNQQAMAGQLGNSIRSGAFGGDRAGIAAANLSQQQQLANAQIYSGILNQGYGQALGTAQQQQALGLSAAQANREAQARAAGQSLALGQERFGQGMTTAQAQAGLGQQLFSQQLGVGQAQQGLGNQYYQQGLGAAGIGIQGAGLGIQAQGIQAQLAQAQLQAQLQGAAGIAGLGQQQFGQNLSAAQAQAGLGQQVYGQQLGTGQAQAGLAGQLFGQGATTAQQQAALSQLLYGQGLGTAQAQQGLGAQIFGQGATTAGQQGQLAQQLYGQGTGTAQAQAGLGQQLFGQGQSMGQGLAGLGQQIYGQGLGAGQAQQGLGAQLYGQGATTAQQLASLGQQQFGQGMTAAQQQQALAQAIYGTGAATSQGLANLGTGAQGAGLAGAQAQLAAGQTEQQTQQAGLTALYNQFLQQQSYPFQVAQFLANIAEGTGALSGNTTTTNQVANGIFSDRRLKENVKKIGETFDGQPIYSFKYKGEPYTEMGLIAQEVEKKHPHAVGLAGGFKTVDYGAATDKSAKRGHFAYGGAPGFDPGLMSQIMSTYQQMYGPLAASKGGLGAGTIVPPATLPVGQLQTAQAPQMQLQSPAQTAKGFADAGNSISELVDTFGLGGDKDKKGPQRYGEGCDPETGICSANSGRVGLATGGNVFSSIPYETTNNLALDIPNEEPRYQLPDADAPKPQKSDPLGDIGKIAKTAASIAALIPSDKRLKENIKPVGKTFDGQTVYSYNFKGDKTPRMGLIAQEVEKKHPRAVGKRGGYKAVDYAKATRDSAERGRFAEGGEIEEEENTNPIREMLMRRLKPSPLDEEAPPEEDTPVLGTDTLEEATPVEEEVVEPSYDSGDIEEAGPALAPVSAPRMALAKAQAHRKGDEPAPAREPIVKPPGKGSRADRNNNPANIEAGSFTRKMPGYMGSDGRFAVFKTAEDGRNAQIALLKSYVDKGYDTPIKIASRWAPSVEKGNNPSSYAKALADHLGIKPTDTVSHDVLPALATAQARFEGWTGAKRKLATGGAVGEVEDALSDDEQARKDAEARALIIAQRAADSTRPIRTVEPRAAQLPIDLSALESAAAPSGPLMPAPVAPPPQAPAIPPQMASGPPADILPPAAAGLGAGAPAMPLAPPAGLAAASDAPLGRMATPDLLEGPKPRGFFKGLGHGDASSIIPLLSGIGALATTQTNNPLTAIAAGLGAGAQAAQGQREFARKSQETRAQALAAQTPYQKLAIDAQNAKTNARVAATGSAQVKIEWIEHAQKLANALDVMGKHDPVLADQIAAMNAAVAADTGAPSAGRVSPTMEGVDVSTPAGHQQAGIGLTMAGNPAGPQLIGLSQDERTTGTHFGEKGGVEPVPGAIPTAQTRQAAAGLVQQNLEAVNNAILGANAGYEARAAADKMAQEMRDEKGNLKLLGGPASPIRTGVSNVLTSLGVPLEFLDAAGLADPRHAVTIDKLNVMLGTPGMRAALGSQFSQAEFMRYLETIPSQQMPTAIALYLIDNVIKPKAQYDIDVGNYAKKLDPAHDDINKSLLDYRNEHSWSGAKYGAAKPDAVPQRDGVYRPASAAQARSLPEGAKFIYPPGSPYAGQQGVVGKGGR